VFWNGPTRIKDRPSLVKNVDINYFLFMSRQRSKATEFSGGCIGFALRRAARVVGRRYDTAFRKVGLRGGQFSILASLSHGEAVPLGTLAERLGMDRTTLTADIRPLERQGFVRSRQDDRDKRVRNLMITDAGMEMLEKAIPVWRQLQEETRAMLTGIEWDEMRGHLRDLAR